MGIMKVSSLILLERRVIVLYNGIDITVDLEVLRFLYKSEYKSELVYVTLLASLFSTCAPRPNLEGSTFLTSPFML